MKTIAPKANKISPFKGSKYESASLSQVDLEDRCSNIILKWIQNPKDILFIHSSPGIGKTHLCAAITHFFLDRQLPVYYMKEKTLFERLRAEIADGSNEERYLMYLCENEFMILDDICSTRNNSDYGMTDWQKDILFTFLDYRITSRFPTVITSNYSIDDMRKMFHERFISRLEAANNTIIHLKGYDKRKEGL